MQTQQQQQQQQQQPQARSDSPADNNFNYHQPTLKPSAYNADTLFNHHSQQNINQNMYNTIHVPPDYSSDNDGQKPQTAKMNGFGSVGSFRTSASFTALPNSNRTRHPATPLGGGAYRDSSSTFSYPPALDGFPSGHMTPSTQAQSQPNPTLAFDSLHQGRGFDFSGNAQQSNGDRKQSYAVVDFSGGASPALLQSHQVGAGKSVGGPLSHHQQQHSYATAHTAFSNNIHIQSQTPYGPHLQTTVPTSGAGSSGPNPVGMNHGNGIASANPSQEEISTIFVVGFPEDMQVSY